jgi:four helix bundle protein
MAENVIVTKSYNFSVAVVKFCFEMQGKIKEYVLSRQLLKSGTSIGANIEEAQGAISKAEFIAKMQISFKEAKETRYWIRLIIDTEIFNSDKNMLLLKDCNEIIVLLTSILKTAKSK